MVSGWRPLGWERLRRVFLGSVKGLNSRRYRWGVDSVIPGRGNWGLRGAHGSRRIAPSGTHGEQRRRAMVARRRHTRPRVVPVSGPNQHLALASTGKIADESTSNGRTLSPGPGQGLQAIQFATQECEKTEALGSVVIEGEGQ